MVKFNKKNVENAPDKIKAGAEEMIKAPMWLIEQVLLKHENAVLEAMKELHDENERLRTALTEICEWTERYTSPGHPITTVAKRALDVVHNARGNQPQPEATE